jgi:flagellar basal body-associated protein FliL
VWGVERGLVLFRASAGATAGIVISVIVVVAAIAGILVFFLVIKKRGDQEFKAMDN